MPVINDKLINSLCSQADKSTLQQRLAAAVIQNNKQLSDSVCNIDRNLCRGHHIPSLHAEARALLTFYGRDIGYSDHKGWCFNNPNYKPRKVDVVVIRTTRDGKLANSRPCRKCLEMMRNLGIKKVYYSSGNDEEIISENVKDMFSIQDSSSARRFARMKFSYPENDLDYYKMILKRSAPRQIKFNNLSHFIRFNLSDLLPSLSYSLYSNNGRDYIEIKEGDNTVILINVI